MGTVTVDLSAVHSHIETVNSNLQIVANRVDEVRAVVDAVAQEQDQAKQILIKLQSEFAKYVIADKLAKELQRAETQLIQVRQELQTKYGHYRTVRESATGILQAADVGVREETIRTAAENRVIECPNYWLPPALLALAAWTADLRDVAERNLAKAMEREDSKTSLFFSLVCRRARRMEGCRQWLVRFFQLQNPTALDRHVIEMINAMANGVFGGGVLIACSNVIDSWLTELELQSGFSDEQRKRWADALGNKTPKIAPDEYPSLRRFTSTWQKLEASLAAARRNQVIQSYFEQLFTGEIIVDPTLEVAIDAILDRLVKDYDDRELPLLRAEKKCLLIIKERGDVDTAELHLQKDEDPLKEQKSFAAFLTSASMSPESSGATPATQRYAVSRSQKWIIDGFQDLTARDRAVIPAEAEISCGSWKGTSRDGSNEQALSGDLYKHYASRIEQAVNAVGITGGVWAATVIGGLIGLVIVMSSLSAPTNIGGALIGLLILAGAGALFFFKYKDLENVRTRVRQNLEKERDEARRILKACLAELTDFRRELAREDGRANGVVELLTALHSPQFILKGPESTRTVIA